MERENLGFKFEQKEIKEDEKLPPLCPDYEPTSFDNCKKAEICKNATYGWEGHASGNCYAGTKSSEREHRSEFREKYGFGQELS